MSLASILTGYAPLKGREAELDIPRIPLNLRDHKKTLAIAWTIMFISSAVLPNALYFILRYAAHLKLSIVFALTSGIFGVVSVFSYLRRTYALVRPSSNFRPIGGSRAGMDFFHWNFTFGVVFITVVVAVGTSLENVRLIALGLPLLITEVCAQLLLMGTLQAARARLPFRISSVPAGDPIRGGAYVLAEDVVAVDGQQGTAYRRALDKRYLASPAIRSLCFRLDLLWGVTGVIVGGMTIAIMFAIHVANVAFILGWVVPWAYAGIMTIVTIKMTSSALADEVPGHSHQHSRLQDNN